MQLSWQLVRRTTVYCVFLHYAHFLGCQYGDVARHRSMTLERCSYLYYIESQKPPKTRLAHSSRDYLILHQIIKERTFL